MAFQAHGPCHAVLLACSSRISVTFTVIPFLLNCSAKVAWPALPPGRPGAASPSILAPNDLSLVVCRGRKRAGLLYVATYTFGCLTKHWNNFGVLLVGRIFCGVATSLLYSAFESWLVAEHFKVG